MSPHELLDRSLVESLLSRALTRGAEFAEIFVEDRVNTSLSLDQRRVEELSSGRSRGAGIRVIVGETTGFAHTADLSEAGLIAAVDAAASVARAGGGGVTTVALESFREYATKVEQAPTSKMKTEKVALLRHADDVARSSGAAISQVSVGLADSTRRFLVASTDGVFAGDHQVRVRLNVQTVAVADGGMQTGFFPVWGTAGYEAMHLDKVTAAAERAAQMAMTKLQARPAPSGSLPVVIGAGYGGMLFHEACGHGLEADGVLKQASVYAGRVGEQVASPLVTLVDDGTMSGEWGFLNIDDEGQPGSYNVLIENGILKDYMWDGLEARRAGRRSSGNGRRQTYEHLPMPRMTNTYLLNGSSKAEDIITSTEYGIYVTQLGGGQVNPATGDFVFGMNEAFLIEHGQITAPLREANLIGNGPEVLANVDAVADDFAIIPGTCGKWGQQVPVGSGQPTMRVTAMTVGGTAA
jgi:TldD protein